MGNASVTERIVMLVSAFTSQKSDNITMTFRQRDLCRLLGARRPAFISALEYLLDKELIEMPDNTTIIVKSRKALLQLLNKKDD
jgi:hypothetical protein